MTARYLFEGGILLLLLIIGACLRFYTRRRLSDIESNIKIQKYKDCKGKIVDATEDEEKNRD